MDTHFQNTIINNNAIDFLHELSYNHCMIITTNSLRKKLDLYKNPDTKIRRLCDEKKLIKITRGFYETNAYAPMEAMSYVIYGPSYVSFERALEYYGLIPETVPVCTCATFGKNKRKFFENEYGAYQYRDIPTSVYPYGLTIKTQGDYKWTIAKAEKALCDLLHVKARIKDEIFESYMFDGLRIDEDMFYELDAELLIMLARLYPSHNLRLLEKFVQENYREFKT